jgi:outer membrane protein
MKTKLPLIALTFALLSGAASAETLRDALVKAYQTNPTMTAARAGQRANDENVPIARARGLPDADVSGGFNQSLFETGDNTRNLSTRISASAPIYTAGLVKNSVAAAKARVEAGRANLRGTEADLFTAVVAAYMDVIRDQAIVGLNQTQVKVLGVNLEATKDRFEVGDLTRTDVAQSEARLSVARGRLEQAEAQLISSREQYVNLVGDEPINLQQPPQLPNLPLTVDSAVDVALESNPDLIAAAKAREAAGYDINVARTSRMPRVQGVADGSYTHFLGSRSTGPFGPSAQSNHSVGAGVQASFPLFQGGAASAQIRQAQARKSQAIEQVIAVERGVIAQTRSSYAFWHATREVIKSSQKAVSASKLALEGVRAENSVGTRTILDILDAQQELLNAEVLLVTAERDSYVAGFRLLASMGQAEARDLGLDAGPLYDPTVNYERVRRIIWDWQNDPEPGTAATRTVDTAPQTPTIARKSAK